MFAAPSGRIAEQHDWRTSATKSAIIAGDRPEEALPGPTTPRIEHRRCSFIHEQAIRRSQMSPHAIGDGLEVEAGTARPVAQCRPIELDALASIDLGLAVERQMITEFRDDDLRDQCLGRQPAGHHMLGRRRLHHGGRAATAGVFRAPRDQHT